MADREFCFVLFLISNLEVFCKVVTYKKGVKIRDVPGR